MQKISHARFEVHNNLQKVRKRKGLTQEQVARLCYIRCQTYSHIENGKSTPQALTMLCIAEALEKPMDELFCLKKFKII